MVEAPEGPGPLEGGDVGGVLDDAEHRGVAAVVPADRAGRLGRQVEAHLTQAALLAQPQDRLAELGRRALGSGEQEERQTGGRLLTDAGQPAQRLHQALHRRGTRH